MNFTATNDPQRRLTQRSLTVLVIASMIGAGVFTTTGFSIADLREPPLVMAAWVVGGLIAICGAIGYGALADRLTDSGGEYLYLSRYLHPAAGFVAGWVSMLAGFTSAAAIAAIALDHYVVPQDVRPGWLFRHAIAYAVILIATAIHAFRTEIGSSGQNVLVYAKLLFLLAFIAIAAAMIPRWNGGQSLDGSDVAAPPLPRLALTFATSVMWISLSYSGFNAAIYVAGEAIGGSAAVRRAMVGGTVLVTILYLMLNVVYLYATPPWQIAARQDVAAVVAARIGGDPLAWVVRIGICLGLASSVSSAVMAGPRVYAKMGQDGWLPSWLTSTRSPPTRLVILQGIAVVVVVSVSTLPSLLSYLGMTLSLCGAATVATLFLDRPVSCHTPPRADHPRRPGIAVRVAAALYIAATLVTASLAGWNQPRQAIAVIVTLATGLTLYALHRRFARR